MENVYEAVSKNKSRSVVIVALFLVFVFVSVYFLSRAFGIYLGYSPGGLGYFGLALIVSGISSFGGYYFSDSIVLAISGARPASKKSDYNFFTAAENISIASGLPVPKLYVTNDPSPNAFATGRDPERAAICATRGLISTLNKTELEGVVAHEMGHIKNYDTRLQSVVAVLVGVVALLGDWFLRMRFWGGRDDDRKEGGLGGVLIIVGILFAIASPIVAQLIQLAISRRREFLADSTSALITKQPSGLISALRKISSYPGSVRSATNATAHLFIVNPLKGRKLSSLFNTHPPVEERIKALQAML